MIVLDPVPKPIDHVLRGASGSTAIIDRNESLSFWEAEGIVGAIAGWLIERCAPGDRVASWLPKTRIACLLPLAVARAGMIHVPINPLLRRLQVAHILDDSGAAMLITQSGRMTTLEEGDVPTHCTKMREEALCLDRPGPGRSSFDPNSLAAILYTSGSTGRPKGVMLSHANLWLGAVAVAHYLALEDDDRVLAVLPLSFDYGQNQLLSSWIAGATVVPLDYLVAADVVKAVARFRATTLAGVPPLWMQLLAAKRPGDGMASLRRLTNSGGALSVSLVRQLREQFPQADLYAMYGLTEAFRSTYLDPNLIDEHPESIGRAVPFAEVLVVRPDGSSTAVDEPGELVHTGPLVAKGYWRDDEKTAERFRPAPAFAQNQGPAVWSGDTVLKDADGRLRFVGRDDDMIKVSGNRISPQEIEEVLLADGHVLEAVAIGVPDAATGQAIVVMVAGSVDLEVGLRARLRTALPSFMQPTRYVWRDDLPRNPNGKFDRTAIRAEVLS